MSFMTSGVVALKLGFEGSIGVFQRDKRRQRYPKEAIQALHFSVLAAVCELWNSAESS